MGLATVAVFILWATTATLCYPFLHNAPRALTTLATSASASASIPEGPVTHIADLRVKQQKAQQLQAEKQLAEDDATKEGEDVGNNEASPSIFQKKVFKILTKLRIISSISNGFSDNKNNTNTAINDTSSNVSGKLTDNSTKDREEIEEWDTEIENNLNIDENSTEEEPTFQKVIYPDSSYGVPIKLRVPSERQVEAISEEKVKDEKPTGRLEQIGVFFAELVGSIFGLVYGAAAQINNSVQGTTAARIE